MCDRQFWLARLDQHGNPTLVDGSHRDRAGVEQALYLFRSIGLGNGESYTCAEVILTGVEARSHGANEEAISTLNGIGVAP